MLASVAMIAGGAEELCVTEVAVFDTLFATTCRNDAAVITLPRHSMSIAMD